MNNAINKKVTWAHHEPEPIVEDRLRRFGFKNRHWSRVFEYPWLAEKGCFRKGQLVLDAAGGNGDLQHYIAGTGAQVVNVDLENKPSESKGSLRGILFAQADLTNLQCFQDDVFDRVVCCSVLEHVNDPVKAVRELWRVLKPYGTLVMSFDVASYARWNHTIDMKVAVEIMAKAFAHFVPPKPPNVLSRSFDEIDPKLGEPKAVELNVLCFACEKGN
jgi:ubiquinone/menaquinone biosynthesis C-methylase UbiE